MKTAHLLCCLVGCALFKIDEFMDDVCVEAWDLLNDQTALSEIASMKVSKDGCWIVTEALGAHQDSPRILAVGDAFLHAIGRSRKDLLLKNPKFLRHSTCSKSSLNVLRRNLMTWVPVEVRLVNSHATGTPVEFSLRVDPLYGDQHWFQYWLGRFELIK